MTREDFRRELGDAFEAISGPPSRDLSDRVRSALVEAPERHDQVWIAALAAAVIAVILVGVLLVSNPLGKALIPSGGGHPTPTTSPSPSPSPTASSDTGAFICSASSAIITHQSPPVAFVDAIRTGSHPGYDRVTIEFNNGQPATIELRPQSGTTFTQSSSGQPITLAGKDGLLVTITGSDAHIAYSGSRDIKVSDPGLLEVRIIQDFEGKVSVALGLANPACYRAVMMPTPTRLVIDIKVG
ncbi:MAG: hypothetical protein M3082_22220 [Candidatus Dormibacteraeota bacterium]|nr:hypothetical protein [Candidatus Dormibacteraeota bacterium]